MLLLVRTFMLSFGEEGEVIRHFEFPSLVRLMLDEA